MLILFWLSQTWPVTLMIQEWVFSGCTVPPDSKETELGSSDQAASSSAGRTTRVILVPCHTWKCVPTAISGGVLRYLRSLCVICYDRWVFSVGCKNYFKDWCFMNSQPTFPFLTYFNSMIYGHIIKRCKPDNFESHISLRLSFLNIWGLCSNFVDSESFLKSSSHDILALCETNLDNSIDSGNLSVSSYLLLIWKNSTTHMHGLAIYVKEGLPFAQDLTLEKPANVYLRFWLVLTDCLTSVSSIDHLLCVYVRFLILSLT